MFDGSALPLDHNLRLSSSLLDQCDAAGVVLEIECGVVGGEEDAISAAGVPAERLYTTTDDLLRVAELLGTGERGRYLLAATFGNVHGVYAPGHVKLRPEILRDGQEALAAARPGARFQYVFHGSSGSSDDDIRAAISYGVVKINIDSDAQYVLTRAIADHVLVNYSGVLKIDGGIGDKKAYDPRAWGKRAEAAMASRVTDACELFGSAGRSLTA
jgi:fructose-bisphosphate aldolase class II